MIALLLGTGLTVISAATASASPSSWSCGYVAERLPRTLSLLGDDAVSAEETRAARKRLALSEAVLTRASGLALARSLGASRLIVVRCLDGGERTTLEAQSFDAYRPEAGAVLRVTRPLPEISAAIDEIGRALVSGNPREVPVTFRSPSPRALAKTGSALIRESASERARGLTQALGEDPASIDVRLSAVEALMAARDFDAVIQVASVVQGVDAPQNFARALRFQAGAALLEAGRYLEAQDAFEALRRAKETAAVLNNLGIARFRLREGDASGFFERASFFVDHRQGDIAFNRSLALLFENKAEAALAALDDSLRANPSEVRTRLLRVWALKLLSRDAERGAEWERLVALAPSYASLGNPDLARRLERIFYSERTP